MPKLTHSFEVWPLKVTLKKEGCILEIEFDDGENFHYPAEYLRIESPSAEVRGHGMAQKRLIGGCKYVTITAIESVGNYAIRIVFDDGHSTGIYSWSYLHQLGLNQASNWQRYLHMLEAWGLSREA